MADRTIIQRVLQYKGRRFPLRLEQGFWTALNRIAKSEQKKLSAIVADLANADPPPVNLAGAVREFAIIEFLRRSTHTPSNKPGSRLDLILNSAPAPGFLIDPDRIIIDCNDAFVEWCKGRRATLLGNRLEDLFRCDARNLNRGWSMLEQGTLDLLQFPVVFLSPGRLSSTQACVCPAYTSETEENETVNTSYLVWLLSKNKG